MSDDLIREVMLNGIDVVENTSDLDGRGERARAYFNAWVQLLKSGEEAIPAQLLGQIAVLFEYLARGIIPAPIEDCRRRKGGRPVGPTEERDIRRAVVYILASKRGLLNDRSYIKTVMKYFGSKTRQNVQAWVTKYESSITSDELSEDPEVIAERMRAAGAQYSVSGRRQTPIEPG
jgi:hypothetical protein